METKRYFLTHFYHPRFARGYDQNPLFITDASSEKKTSNNTKTDDYRTEVI